MIPFIHKISNLSALLKGIHQNIGAEWLLIFINEYIIVQDTLSMLCHIMNGANIMNNYKSLSDGTRHDIQIVLKSLLVGTAAGGIAVLYRILLTYAEDFCFTMYDFLGSNLKFLPLFFLIFCGTALLTGFLVKKNKMISGSGIPQLEGILKGYFRRRKNWWNTLILKMAGGAICIAAGLSLGREGPSIQLGSCVAEGLSKKLCRSRLEKKILMASGASAGLAAAFNAPMAGVIFALEEIFKYFSPIILLSTMSAAVAADFVSKEFFGMKPVFDFEITGTIPLSHYGALILLGILLGGMGAFYNWSLEKTKVLYSKLKFLNTQTKIIVPFVSALILGLVFPVVLCGGHRVLAELTVQNGICLILLIFAVKFVFSMISFGSGAPGGIFFPLLILGACLGSVYALILIRFTGLDEGLFNNFIILAMAGYFTAIVRAPITGVVLIMEMTGSFTHMLSLTVVSVTAYVVADLCRSMPVYDSLLENLIKNEQPETEAENDKKILVELVVRHGSRFENKAVKNIEWPGKCLLVAIKRGDHDIIPKGNTKIKVGDYLSVLTDLNSESSIREILHKMNGDA